MIEYIGFDANGIRRVYARNELGEIAETQVREEALSYVERRPDTGPLDKWTFERYENFKRVS